MRAVRECPNGYVSMVDVSRVQMTVEHNYILLELEDTKIRMCGGKAV